MELARGDHAELLLYTHAQEGAEEHLYDMVWTPFDHKAILNLHQDEEGTSLIHSASLYGSERLIAAMMEKAPQTRSLKVSWNRKSQFTTSNFV